MIVVFSGPSLSAVEREAFPQVQFMPPARQGDILLASRSKPSAIGLIDGYFGDCLAPHQKEILEVMASGIPVYGAASLGALRAAELSRYGMIGIGSVYRSYQTGEIDCDAEVAVAHGPAELSFVPTSISMIDVRATIDALLRRDLITQDLAKETETIARGIFFRERSWSLVLKRLSKEDAEVLQVLLEGGAVHQKRLDAVELLVRMTKDLPSDFVRPKMPPMTLYYQRIRERALGMG